MGNFVSPAQLMNGYSPLSIPQYGIVLDNNDPEHLMRIKVRVDGIMEGDKDDLPWIFPQTSSLLGAKSDGGLFIIPEIDSEVILYWPNKDDIYHCYYYATHPSKKTIANSNFLEDYPETYGFTDKTGQYIRVNKKKNYVEFKRPDSSWFQLDGDGNLHINIPGDVIINVGKNMNLTVSDNTNMNAKNTNIASSSHTQLDFNSSGFSGANVDITGSNINMKGIIKQN